MPDNKIIYSKEFEFVVFCIENLAKELNRSAEDMSRYDFILRRI